MPDSRDEKRAVTAFLNAQQLTIYNLYTVHGLTTDEIQRELVWNLKLGWVRCVILRDRPVQVNILTVFSYGRLQAAIKGWKESSRPGPWPERSRGAISRPQTLENHVPGARVSLPATSSPHQNYSQLPLHRSLPENLMHNRTTTLGVAMSMASSNNR